MRHMLGRASAVDQNFILEMVHGLLWGDVGGQCRTRADNCKQSGAQTVSDAADNPAMFREAFS